MKSNKVLAWYFKLFSRVDKWKVWFEFLKKYDLLQKESYHLIYFSIFMLFASILLRIFYLDLSFHHFLS